jgi:DNA polymerase
LSAAPWVPQHPTLPTLRAAVQECRGCPLWEHATQAVFGAGPRRARLMLVGEQPGNEEDLAGSPFVGPAGRLLDRCLVAAGIARDDTYVTNAVKHFKWKPAGARRLHAKPTAREIAACRPWLDAELAVVRPEALVCLGATATLALLGPNVRVTVDRGRPLPSSLAPLVLVTTHPSAVLRAPDAETREAERERLIDDLRVVADALAGGARRLHHTPGMNR